MLNTWGVVIFVLITPVILQHPGSLYKLAAPLLTEELGDAGGDAAENEITISTRSRGNFVRIWPSNHPSIPYRTYSKKPGSPFHPVVRFRPQSPYFYAHQEQKGLPPQYKPVNTASELLALLSTSILGKISNNRFSGQRFGLSKKNGINKAVLLYSTAYYP